MPWRASLVALALVFNACAPFATEERSTEEPAPMEQPIRTEPATESAPADVPPETPASAPAADAGSDDGGGADAGPPPRPDCTFIDCFFH